ncbi:MAG: hypothetical protein RR501_02065 [Cloacibacillus sp.]
MNIRLILLAAVLFTAAFVTPAFAGADLRMERTPMQPDGSSITIKNCGDERAHWIQNKEGFVLLYDEATKWWNYAGLKDGKVVSLCIHAKDGVRAPKGAVTGAEYARAALCAKKEAAPQYAPGEALVVLKSGVLAEQYAADKKRAERSMKKTAETTAAKAAAEIIQTFTPVADASVPPQMLIMLHLRSKTDKQTMTFIEELNQLPEVLSATPNGISRLH